MPRYGSVPTEAIEAVCGSRSVTFNFAAAATLVSTILLTTAYAYLNDWPWLRAFIFTSYVETGVGYGAFHIDHYHYFALACFEGFGSIIVGSFISIMLAARLFDDDEEECRTLVSFRRRLMKCLVVSIGIMLVFGGITAYSEDWSLKKTVYWLIDMLSTVGCGYVEPKSSFARVFAIPLIFIGSPTFVLVVSTLIQYPRVVLRDAQRKRAIDNLTKRDDVAFVSREDLVYAFLVEAHLLHPDDLRQALDLCSTLRGGGAGAPAGTKISSDKALLDEATPLYQT